MQLLQIIPKTLATVVQIAAKDDDKDKAGTGTVNTTIQTVPTEGDTDPQDVIIRIINGIIGVLALVCVIVMIVGGVTYMTSAGDAGKVKKGKDTILYGLIGLIICALSAVIVNFVITNIISNNV